MSFWCMESVSSVKMAEMGLKLGERVSVGWGTGQQANGYVSL
jgi:hypothetical protein